MPIPSPVDLPDPGIELGSPALQDSLPAELPGKVTLALLIITQIEAPRAAKAHRSPGYPFNGRTERDLLKARSSVLTQHPALASLVIGFALFHH